MRDVRGLSFLFNRALLVVLLQRAWQGFGGLITIWVIATHLSVADQGWYYAFLGLAAFASFFDLGMSVVIVQTSARVTALLKAGRTDAGPEGLVAHFRSFYIKAVTGFLLFGLVAGWAIFATPAELEVRSWHLAWIGLVAVTAGNLWFVPYLSILEGSGAVFSVYALRLLQGVCGSFLTWTFLIFGDPLWATIVAPAVSLILVAAYAWSRGRGLKASKINADEISGLSSLKWRVAVSWISGYCLIQVSPPLLLRLGFVEDSGRMGLSLAIVNMIGILAISILTTLVPKMAELAEKGDDLTLNDLFKSALIQSSLFYFLLALAVLALLGMLHSSIYADRFLPLGAFVLLLAAGFCSHILSGLAVYLRSYFREPYAFLLMILACASMLTLIIIVPRYGVSAYIAAFAAFQVFVGLPAAVIIFLQTRKVLQQ